VQSRPPGEAIGVYRNAIKSGAVPDAVDPRMPSPRDKRRSLLHDCETEAGSVAEQACEAAWLPGPRMRSGVFKRRGLLLQNDNRPGASARCLSRGGSPGTADRDVARAWWP